MEQLSAKTKVIKNKASIHKEVVVANADENKRNIIKEIQLRRKSLTGRASQIAGDDFYHKNYYYSGAKESTSDKKLHTVDRFYPYAVCGHLFIDEPQDERGLMMCKEKAKIMKVLGHKYLIIERNMTEIQLMEAAAICLG